MRTLPSAHQNSTIRLIFQFNQSHIVLTVQCLNIKDKLTVMIKTKILKQPFEGGVPLQATLNFEKISSNINFSGSRVH